MHKITPCVWFDNQAMEAATFYTSLFENSEIYSVSHYLENSPMPAGSVLVAKVRLANLQFELLNGGPVFEVNPSISFFVDCETEDQFNKLWNELSKEGSVLMEVNEYPFSKKFGWCADRFGVNWQLILSGKKQNIAPYLLFGNDQYGKAEDAINFYESVFVAGKKELSYYEEGSEEKGVRFSSFSLDKQRFHAIDSGYKHDFDFNEAVSFCVYCKDQEDIDYLWERFIEGGEAQECGWLKDKYGVSWQILNEDLDNMIEDEDTEKAQRVMDALLKMVKVDIKTLQDAYNGKK